MLMNFVLFYQWNAQKKVLYRPQFAVYGKRKFELPDGVTGERHSEGLQAIEQLFFRDARTQLMDILLGWKRTLMLAVP